MVATSLVTLAAVAGFFVQTTLTAPSPAVGPEGGYVKRAASCTFLVPPTTSSLSAPITVTGTFDGKTPNLTTLLGGNVRYDRGSGACSDQAEGGDSDAVFILQSGATLQNVVIGANQAEGIHCVGPCNLYNVWFEDVCQGAVTIKQISGQSNIIGGGAKNASDEVIQQNGGGTVKIDSYCVQNFGVLYRSCGNCTTQYKRTVLVSNLIAMNGKKLVEINSNYGDVAQFDTASIQLINVPSFCDTYKGNSGGSMPTLLTTNVVNPYCKF